MQPKTQKARLEPAKLEVFQVTLGGKFNAVLSFKIKCASAEQAEEAAKNVVGEFQVLPPTDAWKTTESGDQKLEFDLVGSTRCMETEMLDIRPCGETRQFDLRGIKQLDSYLN